jgi:bacterioferritin
MHGNDKVLEHLSVALKAELTAINQYFLHAKMCENWGYFRLGKYYRKESIEEMVHAEKLMNRILFLEGTNMTDIGPIKVGKNVKAQLENDLVLELDAVKHLNVAIRTPLRPATTPLARCLKRFSPTKKNTSIIWRASCTRSAR